MEIWKILSLSILQNKSKSMFWRDYQGCDWTTISWRDYGHVIYGSSQPFQQKPGIEMGYPEEICRGLFLSDGLHHYALHGRKQDFWEFHTSRNAASLNWRGHRWDETKEGSYTCGILLDGPIELLSFEHGLFFKKREEWPWRWVRSWQGCHRHQEPRAHRSGSSTLSLVGSREIEATVFQLSEW